MLKEKVRDIAEITISPKKMVSKNWGVTTKSNSLGIGSSADVDYRSGVLEIALFFRTSRRTKLERINVNITKLVADKPVFVRFMVYDKNLNSIFTEDLTDYITAEKVKNGTFSFDCSRYSIWLRDDFYVSMQLVNFSNGKFYMNGGLFGNRTVYRENLEPWQNLPVITPALNIDVKVDKNYRNDEEESRKNTAADEFNFLKVYKNEYELQNAARKTAFGNNEAAGKYFKTNDLEMYYETYGEGEPLFLLHGNGGSIQAFYRQITEFSRHYKVIAVDTRAQGKSKDSTTADFTYELFADDLKRLSDHLNISKANIIGWSDGGIVGLIFAMKHPENIGKLIAVGANITPEGVDSKDIKRIRSNLEHLQNAQSQNINAIRLTKLMLEQPNISKKDLSMIKIPTLIVAGENDIIEPWHTKEIAESIPGAKLKIVKNASHSLMQEKSDEFNGFALRFLRTGSL